MTHLQLEKKSRNKAGTGKKDEWRWNVGMAERIAKQMCVFEWATVIALADTQIGYKWLQIALNYKIFSHSPPRFPRKLFNSYAVIIAALCHIFRPLTLGLNASLESKAESLKLKYLHTISWLNLHNFLRAS